MTLKKDKKSAKKLAKSGTKTSGTCEEVSNGEERKGGTVAKKSGSQTDGSEDKDPLGGLENSQLTVTDGEAGGKLQRKPSLRRKFGALIRNAELPTVISRNLIRRSFSFSKDLHRLKEPAQPYRTSSAQWYNSLGSLAEDEHPDESDNGRSRMNSASEEDVFSGRAHVTRTYSLVEKNPVSTPRRRVSTISGKAARYGRHSEYYDSSIDLSNPPCEASSLPALAHHSIHEDENKSKLLGGREQQVKNGWGNLRASARNLSLLRLPHFSTKQQSSNCEEGKDREASRRVEPPGDRVDESSWLRTSGLRSLVRKLSSSGGAGRRAIGLCGRSGGNASEYSNWWPIGGCASGQQPVVGSSGITVSTSGTPSGRGTQSRRSSRELSPSKSLTVQDASILGGGGGAGPNPAASSSVSGQDWRRLVGSIRRKVRRKTAQSSASISEATLQETNRNQDDFLKATMRIFLVVSPPMGRIQVRSRSLTQLDVLGSTMLDTGEHHLGGGSSQQQTQHLHQHHLHTHQLQHHPHSVEGGSPRFLTPSALATEGPHTNRTRPKLSRSQVSSSEYFSISFEVGEDTNALEREEFLPATKGTSLAETLSVSCERRGIDLSRVEVLDNSQTPLPILTTDTSLLGGKQLRIIAKDDKASSRSSSQRGNQSLSLRKTSGSYRCRSGRFFSVSTEDSSVDSEAGQPPSSGRNSAGAAGLKASKQRWSGFFTNTKGTKLDLLTAQLDEYNKYGVPKLTDAQLPYELTLNEDGLYDLEEDWRIIVKNSDQLTEKQQQQQTAIWELAQTEVAYIKTLKVVTDLFMACLCSLQASNILNEADRTRLFSNIPDIYAANRYFWIEHVLTMVNTSRSTGQPLDPGHLLQGFETFEQIFAPYTRYCSEQSRCQQYCRDRLNDNQLFTVYLVWCETQKDCNRLKLLDILVKPMQRLTKYSLLLKAVHKNTENEEQRAELSHMIKSVDDFVASVNAALKRSEESARLASAASRIESYDVVESRDEELEKLIKIHSNFDITSAPIPGCPKETLRILLREGELRLRDAATSKMEVRVLLLTDMLLICKPSTKKTSSSGSSAAAGGGLKIIRQPYVVDRIRIHELKEPTSLGLVYLNEFGAASAALVLTAGEQKLAKSWMESLRKAQQQFALMKVPPIGNTLTLGTVSRQPSTYLGDDFETEEIEGIPKTPRGSSRASRVSSLAHSHSGSMEMEGVSPGSNSFLPSYNASRNISMETSEPPRASSVSSEEGCENATGHNHRAIPISGSKMDNRRFLLSKSPTPNTLSVLQVPAYSSLGQSLPNLTLATSPQTSTVSPTPPNSLLIVPQITKSKDTLLSPGHRGSDSP